MARTVKNMRAPASTTQPSAAEIVIDCPAPPSLNRLWRFGRKRVYKNPNHARWMRDFFYAWRLVCPFYGLHKPIKGPFEAEILICPKRKRDCDNNAKAILDACQDLGIIANDSQARKVTQELVEKERAPMGCRLRIIPLG